MKLCKDVSIKGGMHCLQYLLQGREGALMLLFQGLDLLEQTASL